MSTIESQEGLLSRQSIRPGTVLNSLPQSQLDFIDSAAILDTRKNSKISQISFLPTQSQVSVVRAPTQASFLPEFAVSRKASEASVRLPTQASFYKDLNSRKASQVSLEPTSVESRIAHDLLDLLRTSGASRQSVQRSLTHLSQTNQISHPPNISWGQLDLT